MPKKRPVQACRRCKNPPASCSCFEYYIERCEFEPIAWNGDARVEIRKGFLQTPELVITLGDRTTAEEAKALVAPAIAWRDALVRHRGPYPHGFKSSRNFWLGHWSSANDPKVSRKKGLRRRSSYTEIAQWANHQIEEHLRAWVRGDKVVVDIGPRGQRRTYPNDPEGDYRAAIEIMGWFGCSNDEARAVAEEAAQAIRTGKQLRWPRQYPVDRQHVINAMKDYRRHYPRE